MITFISLYGPENTGIRSMSAALKQAGIKTSLIFFKKWVNNDIRPPSEKEKEILVRLLAELKTDIVGISLTSPFSSIAEEIALRIKTRLNPTIIAGGIHATVKPEECLRWSDFVLRGEGEEAMLELAKALGSGGNMKEVKNISYIEGGKMRSNPLRPLIQDLDNLPVQDYGGGNKFYIETGLIRRDPLNRTRELRVFASRGCPYSCSYCYNSILRGMYPDQRYFRQKKVSTVIEDIEEALRHFKGIKKIKFDDDTFVFPKDWINEFSAEYSKRIGLPFEILYNADCLDAGALRSLMKAGLSRVQVGIQTGSEKECQTSYNRNLSVAKIREFSSLAKELGLNVVYDVILDNPLSDYGDKENLLSLLLELPRPFDIFMYSLTVFPGTKLADDLLEAGVISENDIEGNAQKSFRQFRLSLSYPRAAEELFIACLVSLTSKPFIPRKLILFLLGSRYLKRHPLLLKWPADLCNSVKLVSVAFRMLREGSLGLSKLREYGLPRRFLIQ